MAVGHFGQIGMCERAVVIGGKLDLESEQGKGTRIILTVSLTNGVV